jgi:adenylate kinase
LDLVHVASGDLFRDNLKRQTELGKLAKSYMDSGELVPDDVTQGMVRERLSRPDTSPGVVLDGFPRTLPQAEALADIMKDLNRELDGVLYIKVSDEEIIKRLSGRRICRNCQTPYHVIYNPPQTPGVCDVCGGELYQRDDDNPATARNRLATFHRQTAPLIDYYRQAGLLVELDGEGDVDDVNRRMVEAARGLRKR